MTLFSRRIARETEIGDNGGITWLTPSDYMNILGMLVFIFGVYLLPVLNFFGVNFAQIFFGLGLFLFIGQALGTAAHYQLFKRSKKEEQVWFPKQEKAVLTLFGVLSIAYLIIAFLRLK